MRMITLNKNRMLKGRKLIDMIPSVTVLQTIMPKSKKEREKWGNVCHKGSEEKESGGKCALVKK